MLAWCKGVGMKCADMCQERKGAQASLVEVFQESNQTDHSQVGGVGGGACVMHLFSKCAGGG